MVPTRWNSTFQMISRFLELREEVNTIINRHSSAPVMVTAREIEELKIIRSILQPLESATVQLSGQSYSTSSIVIPLIFNMEHNISCVPTDSSEIAECLKKNLLNEIKVRLGSPEQVHLLAIATLLDPRFKKMYFKNPLNRAKTADLTSKSLPKMRDTQAGLPSTSTESLLEPGMDTQLWAAHQQKVQQNMADFYAQEDSESEVTSYLRSSFLPLNQSPLEWWETNKTLHPRLYKTAMKHLTMVATLVPSESLFSKAGLTMTKQRSQMKPKRLSCILFLQSLDKQL